MELHELMIGNWIQVDDLPPEEVTLEMLKTLHEHPDHLSLFKGIPVTEIILKEWFGFKKREPHANMGSDNIYDLEIGKHYGVCVSLCNHFKIWQLWLSETENVVLESVHQLQQLYSSLYRKQLLKKQ